MKATRPRRWGAQLPLVAVVPFVGMLLAIAIFPLLAGHWWEHNRNKALVAAILAVPLAAYMTLAFGEAGLHELAHKLMEYVSFMALLGALFVISGGIHVQGSLSGNAARQYRPPRVRCGNRQFRGNNWRFGAADPAAAAGQCVAPAQGARGRVLYFIVSNCGGLLTPLGDPPLFLGFLEGVPFEWTLRLWKQWALVNGVLLVIFNVWDQFVLDKKKKDRPGSQLEQVMIHEPLASSASSTSVFGRRRGRDLRRRPEGSERARDAGRSDCRKGF